MTTARERSILHLREKLWADRLAAFEEQAPQRRSHDLAERFEA